MCLFSGGLLFSTIVCMNQDTCAYQTRRIGIMVHLWFASLHLHRLGMMGDLRLGLLCHTVLDRDSRRSVVAYDPKHDLRDLMKLMLYFQQREMHTFTGVLASLSLLKSLRIYLRMWERLIICILHTRINRYIDIMICIYTFVHTCNLIILMQTIIISDELWREANEKKKRAGVDAWALCASDAGVATVATDRLLVQFAWFVWNTSPKMNIEAENDGLEFGRWFSFSIGWSLGSILIFQCVWFRWGAYMKQHESFGPRLFFFSFFFPGAFLMIGGFRL